MSKRASLILATLLLLGCARPAWAQSNPLLGKWNITGQPPNEKQVFWLEVKEDGGTLSGMFLNRGGSPIPVENIKREGDVLTFTLPARPNRPAPQVTLKAAGERVTGSLKSGEQTIDLAGVRPPKWGSYDANAKHKLGKPYPLFDGKSLDAWTVQHPDRPIGWQVLDGVMTNEARGNNLVSREKFQDFKIEAEYNVDKASNSGIYLRGRYELQVLDDFGREPESHIHMAIYARKAPDVNASKTAGEWQTMEATLVGNRVTVVLNGKTVQNNASIDGITGGALDANEAEPGPIMIQGDHGKVSFRKIIVTPILGAR